MRPLRVPIAAADIAGALSEALSRLTGKSTPINRSKVRDMKAPGWVADVEKAKKILGFETRWSLDEAVRENHLLVLPARTAPGSGQSFLTTAARVVKAAENLDVVL